MASKRPFRPLRVRGLRNRWMLGSMAFIILLVMLLNVTLAVTGRMTGTMTISFPLTVSAFPYVARMVEGSLMEVDGGVIEVAKAMGSSTWQIVHKVLVPEATQPKPEGKRICSHPLPAEIFLIAALMASWALGAETAGLPSMPSSVLTSWG